MTLYQLLHLGNFGEALHQTQLGFTCQNNITAFIIMDIHVDSVAMTLCWVLVLIAKSQEPRKLKPGVSFVR